MDDKDHSELALYQIVLNLFHSFFNMMSNMVHMAGLEAKLAVQSLVRIIILSFVFAMLLTSTWLSVMGLIVFELHALQLSWIASLSIVTLVNVVLLALVCIWLLKLKDNLFFPATRRQLSGLTSIHKEP